MIKLRLESGLTARFWIDNWSPFGSLESFLGGGSSRLGISSEATVASLYRNGIWHLPAARTDKQLQLHVHLTTITLTTEADYYEWELAGKISKRYSTGDVYTHLCGVVEEVNWAKAIWSSYDIPRHSFLAWLVINNKCPTRDRLLSWGLHVSPLCLLCNQLPESRDHLFHECHYSYDLWTLVATKCAIAPARDWNGTVAQMIGLPRSKTTRHSTLLTLLAWKATIYWTWTERNSRLHTSTFRSVNSIFASLDRQIRNRLQSFRLTNPTLSSAMTQLWFSSP